MPLLALLILPLVSAGVAAFLPTAWRTRVAAFAGISTLVGLFGLASYFPRVGHGGSVVQRIPWVPELGLGLVLRVDGLSWIFGVLVLSLGALIILYARYYLSPTDPVSRFYAFLLAFIASMLGVILSGNLLQLAFFWELTSVLSFLLIGYWNERKDAQRGARMPFPASTAALALAFLACTLLLAGLPPLPTFIGKAAMLSAAMGSLVAHSNGDGRVWLFSAALLASGLLVLVSLMRTGIRIFWAEAERDRPRIRASEGVPLLALLGLTGALVVAAGPALSLANAAARSLFERRPYIEAVLGARPRPSPSPMGGQR